MNLLRKVSGLLSVFALATASAFAVSITSPSTLPSGTVSTFYSASLTAAGGKLPYSWAITGCAGSCNTGLGFANTGTLSGTPANAGTSSFTVAVTDANGKTATQVATISIAAAAGTSTSGSGGSSSSALTITTPGTLPNGTVSSPYTANLTATGGTSPYTWAIKSCSGSCNTGLGFNASGVLSGTPVNTGTSTFTFGVTDAAGQTATASSTITIGSSGAATTNPPTAPPSNPPAPTAPPAPTSTGSASYFVSPSGSDSNSCTQSSPCATPDHAFSLASPGQTVQAAAGTYDYGSGYANFSKSGTAGNNITVTCATRGACKLQNSVTGNSAVVILGGSYITFDGFEVTNTSSAGNNLGLYVTSSYVNITHNTIHHIETDCGSNGGGGIQVAGSGSSNSDLHDITIDGNLIYDISYRGGSPSCPASTVQTDGILAESAGTAMRVTNNVVHHTSGGWGILVGNPNAVNANVNSVISNNTVFSTAMGGIIIVSGNGTTISNNIVTNVGLLDGRCAINAPPGVSVTYARNDLFNNAGGNYCLEWGGSDQSVHSDDISVDPSLGTTFVNWQPDGSGDYHQKAGSKTIDAGSSTIGAPPATDFDGSARPQGASHDIGAYEYPG